MCCLVHSTKERSGAPWTKAFRLIKTMRCLGISLVYGINKLEFIWPWLTPPMTPDCCHKYIIPLWFRDSNKILTWRICPWAQSAIVHHLSHQGMSATQQGYVRQTSQSIRTLNLFTLRMDNKILKYAENRRQWAWFHTWLLVLCSWWGDHWEKSWWDQ